MKATAKALEAAFDTIEEGRRKVFEGSHQAELILRMPKETEADILAVKACMESMQEKLREGMLELNEAYNQLLGLRRVEVEEAASVDG